MKIAPGVDLTQRVIAKAPGLLPMQYKPAEICARLGITEGELKAFLKTGAPYTVDSEGNLWIVGTAFAEWVEAIRLASKKNPNRGTLALNEATCGRCGKVVDLVDPMIIPGPGKLQYVVGKCPVCRGTVRRGGGQS